MKKRKLVVISVVMILGILLGGKLVSAEGMLDSTSPIMTLSPMSQQVILVPGEEVQGSIKISNAASATTNLNYRLSIGSFSERADGDSEDDYGVIDVQEVTDCNQLMNWITLDHESGSIAPNGVDVVNFTIKVPKSAPAGGQYATILVENIPNRETGENGEGDGAGVMIKSTVQMASIIYANVAGETREEGIVLENKIPTFSFNGTIDAISMIENKGNVHTEAEIALRVWSIFGGENVCIVEDADEGENGGVVTTLVLPETKRFHKETCRLPGAGIYKIEQTVKIFDEESIIEGTLIYCPVWIIVMIVLGVLLIIIWLVMMAMGRRKKQII